MMDEDSSTCLHISQEGDVSTTNLRHGSLGAKYVEDQVIVPFLGGHVNEPEGAFVI
jgi:hypothetical protein